MTRLEVSIHQPALIKFSPWMPSVRTLWHQKVGNFMTQIVDLVLNDKQVLPMIYRRMSIPRLIGGLT